MKYNGFETVALLTVKNELSGRKYKNFTRDDLLTVEFLKSYYNPDLIAEICNRAGLFECKDSEGVDLEKVFNRAFEILKEGI